MLQHATVRRRLGTGRAPKGMNVYWDRLTTYSSQPSVTGATNVSVGDWCDEHVRQAAGEGTRASADGPVVCSVRFHRLSLWIRVVICCLRTVNGS